MLEAVNVAGLGIGRELECIPWQVRLAERLSASSFMVVVTINEELKHRDNDAT